MNQVNCFNIEEMLWKSVEHEDRGSGAEDRAPYSNAGSRKLSKSNSLPIVKFLETQSQHWVEGGEKSLLQAKKKTTIFFQHCWKKILRLVKTDHKTWSG